MNFSRLLSNRGTSTLRQLFSDVASDPGSLLTLDKKLISEAAKSGPSSKIMPYYSKYVGKPANITAKLLYGPKMDTAKLLGTLGAGTGLIHYGGKAARPILSDLSSIARTLNPSIAHYGKANPDSLINVMKPGMAITSKPLQLLDHHLLGGALNMVEHPLLASLALPALGVAAVKGGSKLFSRLGRARRLSQLRQGIAPRAYRQQAQALGYR